MRPTQESVVMSPSSHHPTVPPLDRPTGWRPADEIVPINEAAEIDGKYDWLGLRKELDEMRGNVAGAPDDTGE